MVSLAVKEKETDQKTESSAAAGEKAASTSRQAELFPELRIREEAGRVLLEYVGLRVRRGRLRSYRSLRRDQKQLAVSQFHAVPDAVAMSKKLFDAREPAVKHLRKVYSRITEVIEDRRYTFPCPYEPGMRLVKRGMVETVEQRLTQLREELRTAADTLAAELPQIVARQAARQGELFDPADYAFDPRVACYLEWDFPPVHVVDDTLAGLSLSAYQRELERIRQTYEAACQAKEQELAEELLVMLDHLVAKLEGDGTEKRIFQERTANRLMDILEDAERQLAENGIGAGLQDAFRRVRSVVGTSGGRFKQRVAQGSPDYRQKVRERLAAVAESLFAASEIAPRRAILRRRLQSKTLGDALAGE